MKMSKFILAAAILIFSAQFAMAQDAEAIMKQSHLNYYYSGDDGKADVVMTLVDGSGKERVKEFTMVRKDLVDGGDQLYFVYFKKPSDIRRMTFMVSKHVDSDDDRMLYVPAIDLVKKIAASDKASSFVGSDFSYEDVSGRLWTVDNHELMGEDKIGDTPVYKIKSTPKADDYFAYRISFIDKEQKLPLRGNFMINKANLSVFSRRRKLKQSMAFRQSQSAKWKTWQRDSIPPLILEPSNTISASMKNIFLNAI